MTAVLASDDHRSWMLDAARGDVVSDAALAYVRSIRAIRVHWADDDPELDQALAEGDARHADDPRRYDTAGLGPRVVEADPATTAAFVARTRPFRATRLADVRAERVRWLWPSRLPAGKLVTLDGDPDVGKSTLILDVVARLTTGRPMPGEDLAAVPVSDVVLLAAEDGLADTIRPRLDAAGADVARVHHLDAVPAYDDDGQVVAWVPPSIPEDLGALEALIVETGAVLVVVDVLMAYLSGRADSHRDQDVRRALAQLGEIAERTGACVILLRHLRKSRGSAMYAGGGSVGIIGVARAGMIAAVDPDDETGARRVLARAKGNLAPPYPSLAYTLVPDEVRGCARVEWLGESAHTGDQLLAPPPDAEDRDKIDEATDWLRDVLDRPRKRAEVVAEGRPEGYGEKMLERAAKRLGVVSERDQQVQGRPATWSLPGYATPVIRQATLSDNTQPSDQGKHADSKGYATTSDAVGKQADGPTRPTLEERRAEAYDGDEEW
jgi:hypothetical protein